MSQERNILAVFDEETTKLTAEYHIEETYDDCPTAMSGGGGGGGGGNGNTGNSGNDYQGTVNIGILLLCPVLFIVSKFCWQIINGFDNIRNIFNIIWKQYAVRFLLFLLFCFSFFEF